MWSARQTSKIGHRVAGPLGGLLVALLLVAAPAAAAFVEPINLSSPLVPAVPSLRPAIAVNGKTNQVFVVWQEGANVFLARSQAAPASCGGPGALKFELPLVNLGSGIEPAVAANDSGGVFVAWRAASQLVFRGSTDDGQAFSPPMNLSQNAGFPESAPSVATDNAGGVFVAWSGGGGEIRFARSTNSGATFEPAANLSLSTLVFSRTATVATDGTNVFLAWEEGSFLGLSIAYKKFGRLADLTTVAGSAAMKLSADLPGIAFGPHLAFGDGVLSVAFGSTNGPSVYHRVVERGGVTTLEALENHSGTVASPSGPRVARRNGSAMVAWAERLGPPMTADVEIRYRLGTMTSPATVWPTPGRSFNPAAAIDSTGRLVVAWQQAASPFDEIYVTYSGGTGGAAPMQATVWTKEKVLDLRHLTKGHRGDSERESDGGHHRGGRVTVFIEPLPLGGWLARDINPTTLKLNGQSVLMAPNETDDDDDDDEKGKLDDDVAELGDKNKNGTPDLKVKLSRSAFAAGGPYTLTGNTTGGACFSAPVTFETIKR